MNKTDPIYWTCKIFFSVLWLVYLFSIYYAWDSNVMWHITGILSLIFFIVNVHWNINSTPKVKHD